MSQPIYRQGDVLLRRVEKLPEGLVEQARDQYGRIVLAHGERTGHAHAIRDRNVCSLRFENAEADALGLPDFLSVGAGGASLRHELISGAKAEHDVIMLAEGDYEVIQQVEYSPAELIRVAD